ncbi:MAG: hypothetical protein M1840_003582 [Geoglossum simile]|nr:MAG: hypothetical protein M1840_003582 [Geoglossum simile]
MVKDRALAANGKVTLPNGFPLRLEGDMAWTGSDYEGKPDLYVSYLSPGEIIQIEGAISHFKALRVSRGLLSTQTFPLPEELSSRLQSINNKVNNGRGFVVLRGLQPAKYTEEEIVILYAGLTSYVANNRARFIDHIYYQRKSKEDGEVLRPPELPVAMNFHTDADTGNILSMFTQNKSQRGGIQHLSSFWHVYNTLAEEFPEVLATLAEEWHWEKPNNANGACTSDILCRPIVAQVDGKPQINFSRSFVAGHPKYPLSANAPPLTDRQKDALDTLIDIAKRNSLQLDQEAGDILFINNLSILHARDAFIDGSESDQQRHVLRLWLMDRETGWPIAKSLKYQNEDLWDTKPESQQLCTLTEWAAIPRATRIQGVRAAISHD